MRWVSLGLLVLAACGGGSARIHIGTMPEGASFEGVWQSPQYGNMHLCQTGSQVVGDFEKDERRGRIQGTIQGDVLRFQWEERREMVVGRPQISRGRGYFRIQIGQDGDQYILGEWGHDDQETGGGPWNAAKLRRRRPTRCLSTDSGDDQSSNDEYGGGDYGDEYDDGGGHHGGSADDGGGYHGGSVDDDVDTDELEGLDQF